MASSWFSWKYSAPFGWSDTFSWPLMSLRTRPKTSAWRWLLVACFSSVKNHNVSGPQLLPSFTTHAKKIPLPPLGRSYSEQKNHFAIGRNSERGSYHTDLSRFVLPISDLSALNFSKFVGFQNSPNLTKIEKVTGTCEFDGKEPLFVERTIAISIRVLGWGCVDRGYMWPAVVIPLNPEGMGIGEWVILFSENFEGMGMGMGMGMGNSKKPCAWAQIFF